jgi:hypothetical protein
MDGQRLEGKGVLNAVKELVRAEPKPREDKALIGHRGDYIPVFTMRVAVSDTQLSFDRIEQLSQSYWLLKQDTVGRTIPLALRVVAREVDHAKLRTQELRLLTKLEAAQSGHSQVGNHQIDMALGQMSHRLIAICRRQNDVGGVLKHELEDFAEVTVVIDDEDRVQGGHFS